MPRPFQHTGPSSRPHQPHGREHTQLVGGEGPGFPQLRRGASSWGEEADHYRHGIMHGMVLDEAEGGHTESPGRTGGRQESRTLLKTITNTGEGDVATTRWSGVPATCPIGGATADNHGLSRSAEQ